MNQMNSSQLNISLNIMLRTETDANEWIILMVIINEWMNESNYFNSSEWVIYNWVICYFNNFFHRGAFITRVSVLWLFKDTGTFPLSDRALIRHFLLWWGGFFFLVWKLQPAFSRSCRFAALKVRAETQKCSFCAPQTRNNAATLPTHLSCLKFGADWGG